MIKIQDILPLITLGFGTLLGLFASHINMLITKKQNVTLKIVEQYFKARENISEKLCELANLKTTCELDEVQLDNIRDDLSNLYYKYYDLLPREVLQEIVCLYACLSDKHNRLFQTENNSLTIIKDCNLEKFLDRISLISDFKYYAYTLLKSEDEQIRRKASINFQARSVLYALNQFFTIENLLYWVRHLPKKGWRPLSCCEKAKNSLQF